MGATLEYKSFMMEISAFFSFVLDMDKDANNGGGVYEIN